MYHCCLGKGKACFTLDKRELCVLTYSVNVHSNYYLSLRRLSCHSVALFYQYRHSSWGDIGPKGFRVPGSDLTPGPHLEVALVHLVLTGQTEEFQKALVA